MVFLRMVYEKGKEIIMLTLRTHMTEKKKQKNTLISPMMQRQITVVIVHAKEIRIKLEAMQGEDRSKPGMHSFYHKRNVLILIQKCLES